MRIVTSLLKASAVAALVFAFAWVRLPITASTLRATVALFVGFSFFFAILSLVVGLPLVLFMERIRIGRRWSYTVLAAATGGLLAAVFGRRPMGEVENPHGGMVFSPLTRSRPGIDSFPFSAGEYFESIAFCAIVGAILGLAFWHFYKRGLCLNSSLDVGAMRRARSELSHMEPEYAPEYSPKERLHKVALVLPLAFATYACFEWWLLPMLRDFSNTAYCRTIMGIPGQVILFYGMFTGLPCAIALVVSMVSIRSSLRAIRARHYPPPGEKVFRRTKVKRGWLAVAIASMPIAVAIYMLGLGVWGYDAASELIRKGYETHPHGWSCGTNSRTSLKNVSLI